MFYEGPCKRPVTSMCRRDSGEDYFINFVSVLSDAVATTYCLSVRLSRLKNNVKYNISDKDRNAVFPFNIENNILILLKGKILPNI